MFNFIVQDYFHAGILLGLFDHEDGDDMVLQDVS
jgi:hypothetical protein